MDSLFLHKTFVLNIFLLTLTSVHGILDFLKPIKNDVEIVLQEDMEINSTITTVEVHNQQGNVVFTVKSENKELILDFENMSSTSGNIILKSRLNARKMYGTKIFCTAIDSQTTVEREFWLNVTDLNDHAPVFEDYISTLEFEENQPIPNNLLFTLKANDEEDIGDFGTVGIIFKFQNEQNYPNFKADTNSKKFKLAINGTFDFESTFMYRLEVIAMDNKGNSPSLNSTARITINVLDVDDEDPIFTEFPTIKQLMENSPADTQVFKIKAIDGDRGINFKINYKIIEGNTFGTFKLVPIGDYAVVKVEKPPDREKLVEQGNSSIVLKIMAQEMNNTIAGRNATVDCTVIILDENDQKPEFDSPEYEGTVKENSRERTDVSLKVVDVITVKDLDERKNAYFNISLKTYDDLFMITRQNGVSEEVFKVQVKNSTALDYEQLHSRNPLKLELEAIDTGNPSFNSTAFLNVTIEDENDQSPKFTQTEYNLTITEDEGNTFGGTFTIATIDATDGDTEWFGTAGIRYSILASQNNEFPFEIDELSGEFKRTKLIDREEKSEYSLTVSATDNNGTGNSNETRVFVFVLDVNDNYPVFNSSTYATFLKENDTDFQNRLFIYASDRDLVENGRVEYNLSLNTYTEFMLSQPTIENSVELLISQPLDYERICPSKPKSCDLYLEISASDSGQQPKTSLTPSRIKVTFEDINDEKPVFVNKTIFATIKETDKGITVTNAIVAVDADISPEFKSITYEISDGDDTNFRINSKTGVLMVAKNGDLDFENTNNIRNYELKITASDRADNTDECIVYINVTDVNNKAPRFTNICKEAWIKEDVPYLTNLTCLINAEDDDDDHLLEFSIIGVKAYSPDGGDFTNATYYINLLNINSTKGFIYVNSDLDRETVDKLVLTIKVEDLKTENGFRNSTTAQITVYIEDVNDNPPQFDRFNYTGEVEENSENGTRISPRVVATDADLNQKVTFTVIDPLKLVNISEEGFVQVISNIDREKHPIFDVTIEATDSGIPSLSTNTTFTIIVLDTNDNEPVFVNKENYNVSIYENAKENSLVLQVSAKDADEGDYGKIFYKFPWEKSDFSIDSENGSIYVATSKLDCDVDPTKREIIVEAHDDYRNRLHNSAAATVTIFILDVNDNPPKIDEPNKEPIVVWEDKKGKMKIAQITGTDPDQGENGTIEFYLAENNTDAVKKFFTVEENSGKTCQLYFNNSLEEDFKEFNVEIMAKDKGNPVLIAERTVIITVIINHKPQISYPSDNQIVNVTETLKENEKAFKIDAFDNDKTNPENKIFYEVQSWSEAKDVFSIEDDGNVFLIGKLNRTAKRWYYFNFKVCDSGIPALCSERTCRLVVVSEKDNPPQFQETKQLVAFLEETEPGLEQKRLFEAIDIDNIGDQLPEDIATPKLPICYYIVGGNMKNFQLDRNSRYMKTGEVLDYESQKTHELYVHASNDCRNPSASLGMDVDKAKLESSYLTVTVNVLDVNDQPPQFIQKVFGGGIDSRDKLGTKILQLKAVDNDTLEENTRLNFYRIGDEELLQSSNIGSDQRPTSWFSVDNQTGDIKLLYQIGEKMKGYVQFKVGVNNTKDLVNLTNYTADEAIIRINIIRDDQKSSFTVWKSPEEFLKLKEDFAKKLLELTGWKAVVNRVDTYIDPKTGVEKNDWSTVSVHYIDEDNLVVDPILIEKILDEDDLAQIVLNKEFSVAKLEKLAKGMDETEPDIVKSALFGILGGLLLLFFVTVIISCSRLSRLQRQLKASSIEPYSPAKENVKRKLSELPNTNLHAAVGSNPLYNVDEADNVNYKNDPVDSASSKSEGGSLVDMKDFEGGENNEGFSGIVQSIFNVGSDDVEKKINNEHIYSAIDENFFLKSSAPNESTTDI